MHEPSMHAINLLLFRSAIVTVQSMTGTVLLSALPAALKDSVIIKVIFEFVSNLI